jgi:hypothetical protein
MRERIGMDDVARATPSKEVCGRGLKEQSGGIQACNLKRSPAADSLQVQPIVI